MEFATEDDGDGHTKLWRHRRTGTVPLEATMKIKNLEDLFLSEVRDIYDAEKQLVRALPKMARAACTEELRAGIEEHLEQTRNHVARLEKVFELIGQKARGKSCEAMKGLIEEGKELIDEDGEPAAKDAGLIAAAQKVEHYEIATYGCLATWARQMGRADCAHLLHETLNEEKATDEKLTQLAEGMINAEAQYPAGSMA
jgi:ferritin-like metal-binding protein YciE